MSEEQGFLKHPLLAQAGVRHGFGTKGAGELADVLRPRQVHGARVLRVGSAPSGELGDADAVVSSAPGRPVAIVTADCVPILAASGSGSASASGSGAVAAIHAGWRGLAAGVIEAAIATLRSTQPGTTVRAVVGPHIGDCCYEVDPPVIDALRRRYGAGLDAHLRAGRPGHAWLDLGGLALAALRACGVPASESAVLEDACTQCDALRFHSFRRDGAQAGRLLHWIAAPKQS